MARQQIQEILTQMTPQDTSAGNVFMVARQPIFDQVGAVYAYELLFRDPLTQGFGGKNSHAATSSVMMDGLELMRPSLRGGQRFFINFTEEMLEAELAAVLPP